MKKEITPQLGKSLEVFLEVELAFVLFLVCWLFFLHMTIMLLLVIVIVNIRRHRPEAFQSLFTDCSLFSMN